MKRQLIYNPTINGSSVLFFFKKGAGDQSWSIRDYSRPGKVFIRYARQFDLPLNKLLEGVVDSFDAPTVSINDLEFWHDLTLRRNAELKLGRAPSVHDLPTPDIIPASPDNSVTQFRLIDHHLLTGMPKGRKVADMRRIMTSPNSEDWVTWNALAYARRSAPESWWKHFVRLAVQGNANISLPDGWMQTPSVTLWKCVPTPSEYEMASRNRLRASDNSAWNLRAEKSGPVEGDSEIDISLHNRVLTVFVEAKLGSDVSMKTAFDPTRNQIVRNIDCLLDDTRGTVPFFWMLVRDASQRRAYTQLINSYRANSELLVNALPHRDPVTLREIASRLSIVLWKDLLARLPKPPVDDEEIASIYQELHFRVQ